MSASTRRIDKGEKREAYSSIPSLSTYILAETEVPKVIVFRRTDLGFVREVILGKDSVISIPDLTLELPLAELFDGLESPGLERPSE